MSKVLYRKYRPLSFSEVVGQEHVVKTLKNAIKRGKVAHAYLFSGPRGIGKTTVARILAKAINCQSVQDGEPCGKCEICLSINQNKFLDLVEIDAATHTQVDKIRDIIEKINFSPASGKYKVYIIDEVHMLSKGAFNALLKTLEEPPQHAIFILATTEIHKIPATIISRCQRFDFRRVKISEIKNRLAGIAKKEKVKVGKGVLDFIAINSNGGMRDSESLFGQILSLEGDEITLKEVQEILAVADISLAIKLIRLILEKKYGVAISYLSEITERGYDLEQFSESAVEYCRKLMLIKISPEMKDNFSFEMTEEQIVELENIASKASISRFAQIIRVFIQARQEIGSAIISQLPLELAVAELDTSDKDLLTNNGNINYNNEVKKLSSKSASEVFQSAEQPQNYIKKRVSPEENKNGKMSVKEVESVNSTDNKNKAGNEEISLSKNGDQGAEIKREAVEGNNSLNEETVDDLDLNIIKGNWCKILEEVKPHNHSLTAFLKTCCPVGVERNKIIISCQYSFHKDKLNKIENKAIIEEVAASVLGADILVKFIASDEAEKLGYKVEKIKPVKSNNQSGENNGEKESKDEMVNSALEMFDGKIV